MKTNLIPTCIAVALLCGACRTASVAPRPSTPGEPPLLAATRFVAYGDSITEGFVQRCPGAAVSEPPSSPVGFVLAQGRAQPSPTSYPVKLQELLAQRYPAQAITVANEGSGGEEIQAAVANLPGALTTNMPQVLLLQEGINTLNQNHRDGIPLVVEGLKTMIQEARSRSIRVFVGTLLPQRRGGCRAFDSSEDFDDIIETNVRIRRMVGLEGATLVDLYQAFNGRTATLIGEDGLHPSALGYQRIAEEFFYAIRQQLEN